MTSTTFPRFSIVIPAYQEGGHLAGSLAEIRAAAGSVGEAYELLIVDDGSSDGTWQVLRGLADQWPELRILRLARNFGKEGALLAGLEASRGEAVIIMDADLQHPPGLIPEMHRAWASEGYAVVNAVKQSRGDEGWMKAQLTRIYYQLFTRLTGVDMIGSSDFKLLDRQVVDAYCQFPERNTFFRGLVAWLGFRQKQIPFAVATRAGGTTSWSLLKLVVLAVNSIMSFSTIPLHFITVMGFMLLGLGLLLGMQTLWLYLSGQAVAGFTTVILLLIIVGAFLMIGLGIVGQYLAKIYEEVKRRPRYIVAEHGRPDTISSSLHGGSHRRPEDAPAPSVVKLPERQAGGCTM